MTLAPEVEMPRSIWLIAAVLALVPSAAMGQAWVRYLSREGRFSVHVPVNPSHSTTSAGPLIAHVYKVDASTGYTGEASFGVIYTDYPPELVGGPPGGGGLLAAFKEQLVRAYRGKVIEDRAGQLDGFPSHDLAVETTQATTIRIRLCLANNRLFQAITTAPTRPPSALATRFMSSFHVMDEPPPAEGWQRVITTDGQFHVWVPGRPSTLTKRPQEGLGLWEITAGRGYLTFTTAFADYPEGFPAAASPAMMVAPAAEALLKGASGKVVKEQSQPYFSNPGKEVTAETDKGFLRFRVYAVGKRVYVFSVTGRAEDQAAPEIALFFKTIRMPPKD